MPSKPSPPEDRDSTGHRNPGIQKQREAAAYWKREAMRLKPLEDAHLALTIPGVKEYLSALVAVHYVAHHGVKHGSGHDLAYRPDLHGRVKTSGASPEGIGSGSRALPHSMPPAHDARAFALLRAEDRRCKKLAADALLKLDEIVGESAAA